MKAFLFKFLFILLPILGNCQDGPALLKHQLSIGFDNTLLNHPLLFSPGLHGRYGRALFQHKMHKISAIGSFGLIHTRGIDKRLLFGAGGEYAVHFLKRLDVKIGLQANYLLTILNDDVFEYSPAGEWENNGNLLHQFAPSAHVSLGADLLQKNQFNVGIFFEMRATRLNESYQKKWMEGYVPTFSMGVKSNF